MFQWMNSTELTMRNFTILKSFIFRLLNYDSPYFKITIFLNKILRSWHFSKFISTRWIIINLKILNRKMLLFFKFRKKGKGFWSINRRKCFKSDIWRWHLTLRGMNFVCYDIGTNDARIQLSIRSVIRKIVNIWLLSEFGLENESEKRVKKKIF